MTSHGLKFEGGFKYEVALIYPLRQFRYTFQTKSITIPVFYKQKNSLTTDGNNS